MLSLDGFIYKTLSFLYRCMILNLLYLLSCIFVITIPPATAALFAVVRKSVYNEEPSIFRTYWRAFRENIVKSWVVAAVYIVLGAIVYLDFRILQLRHGLVQTAGITILAILVIFLTCTLTHIFPLMVHTTQSTTSLFSNALKMNMIRGHLTLINLVILALWFFIATRFSILFFILFFSLSAYTIYWTVDQKFKSILAVQSELPVVTADDKQ